MKMLFSLSLLFLFPLLIYGNNEDKGTKHTEEKTIKKEFEVNSDATLKVENSYGNLNVVTWRENRIVIEVHITTKGDDKEAVRKKLNEITVEFHASPNLVSAETIFGDDDDSWFSDLFEDNSVSMEVNYLIKMPMTNNVDLNNDYGNITLDQIKGRADINCDYGKITAEGLMAENNSLNFDYSDNCYFGYINSADINADYSSFTIEKAKELSINADYADVEIKVVEDIEFNSDYGEIEVDNANNVIGMGDYTEMRFGKIYKNANLESDYGSIVIEKMMASAEDLTVSSDYADIEIGIHPDYHFDFSVDLEYASLDAPNGFHFSKQISDSGDKYYEGYFGSSNSGNFVEIESDYEDVEFYVN